MVGSNPTGRTIYPDCVTLNARSATIQVHSTQQGKTMSKKTEWVLVEAVSMFRMRYMVEVPKGESDYALDTVTMNEAEEFSQEHLGETIVSHRVLDKKEALKLFDKDNAYLKTWTKEQKLKSFTPWKEEEAVE